MAENPQTPSKLPRPPLALNQLREIQARHLDDTDVRALLWEIKRLQGQLGQIFNDLGVRGESDASFAREAARMLRSRLDREPAVAKDASERNRAKREAMK